MAKMDLAELQKKLASSKQGILVHHDEKGHAYVSMPVGKVPFVQFEEWQRRCDAEFGGNRWLCIWTDYMRTKQFNLEVEVKALREEIRSPPQEQQESNELGLLNGG